MWVAISTEAGRSSASMTSNTISAQAAAPPSNQLIRAKVGVARVVIDVDDEVALETVHARCVSGRCTP